MSLEIALCLTDRWTWVNSRGWVGRKSGGKEDMRLCDEQLAACAGGRLNLSTGSLPETKHLQLIDSATGMAEGSHLQKLLTEQICFKKHRKSYFSNLGFANQM